uniref:ribosomal protein S8 n=1 Tax=Vallisneria natans TaxID=62345 RepID=UPI0022FD3FA2|nr:ribosomal protein S8 [Vallisneria natans]WAO28693.1 ribosomal protein S8 [Vallisneria natans]
MSKDTLGNVITSIRNAGMHQKETVRLKYTNLTENFLKILLQEGFIENLRKHKKKNNDFLVSTLWHKKRTRKGIHQTILKRLSRPSLRIYSNYKRIPKILGGMGITILSTSQGIMTDREARLKEIGGEMLCHIYVC